MPKQPKSKLDQHAATLLDMDAQKKTLAEMLAWLREEGVTCSASTLSRFLESQRQEQLEKQLLARISSGARQVEEMEKEFRKNPAPELETIIKLHRVLSLQLATQSQANPELIKLADQLTRTALEYTSGKTKAAQKEIELKQSERKLQILEKKAAAFDQAKEVISSKLSPEEQKKRLKEILK